MSKSKSSIILLLILQVVAILIYPPTYFQRSPQALVMPPALLILAVLAMVGVNTGTLSLENGRSSLVFIQGINIVVRLMTLFPNLRTPGGAWAWGLLISQIIGIGLSWYTMIQMDKIRLQVLRFTEATPPSG
jgi:hypothetical protein